MHFLMVWTCCRPRPANFCCLLYVGSNSLFLKALKDTDVDNTSYCNCIESIKTSKFEWMVDNIGIEKIISAPIWVTIFFCLFEVSVLLDARHCPKLQSWVISRKTIAASYHCMQKKTSSGPDFGPFGPNFYLY